MVLTRAFACGLPVVASDIPGYREVLTPETSIAVPPGDIRSLADAVAEMLADEPRREAMGAAARSLALEKYAWTDIARRLEAIYDRVAGRVGSRPPHEGPAMAEEPVGPRRRRAAAACRGPARRLVARPGLGHRLPRVRLRGLALGRRGGAAQPALGAGTRDLVAAHDLAGAPRSAADLRAGVLRLRDRPARQRRAAGTGRRARPRGRASAATCPSTAPARPPPCSAPSSPTGCSTSSRCRSSSSTCSSTAKIPHWAVTSLAIFFLVGITLLAVAVISARRAHSTTHPVGSGVSTVRRLLVTARQGLAVLRAPATAAVAIFFQFVGWVLQLFAVWVVMEAFDMGVPLPAAGLVLLLMNVATIFPLWPGNIGLLQAAIALPLVQYGVAYGTGFAYAVVLQAVEMSVGVGVGLIFLAREGLSLGSLQRMEEEQESEEDAIVAAEAAALEAERAPVV